MTKYTDPRYDGLETDPRLLEAIVKLTGGDLMCERSRAYRLWEDGASDQETAALLAALPDGDFDGDGVVWGAGGVWATWGNGEWRRTP